MRLLFVINVPGDMRHGTGRSFAFVGRELEKMGHTVEYISIKSTFHYTRN